MQRFVTCSRTRGSGFVGISLAATEKEKKKVLEFFVIQDFEWILISILNWVWNDFCQ
jgi:hypothetical protein